MAKRIIAYTVFVLGFLTYVFFRHYNGQSVPYPFAFWVIGISMLIGGTWLLRRTPTIQQSKEADAANKFIADLKANGDKIKVDLDKCEVKENNYSEERLRNDSHADDAIPIDEEKKTEYWTNSLYRNNDRVVVQINQTVVTGEAMRFGMPFRFRSKVLRYDRETLLFKMFAQKETTLYIDRDDQEKYYLDMEFLSPH